MIALVRILPKKLLYYCAIQVVCEATKGKYSNTIVGSLNAMEAIGRFARIHAIRGNGKDLHYDSNRGKK